MAVSVSLSGRNAVTGIQRRAAVSCAMQKAAFCRQMWWGRLPRSRTTSSIKDARGWIFRPGGVGFGQRRFSAVPSFVKLRRKGKLCAYPFCRQDLAWTAANLLSSFIIMEGGRVLSSSEMINENWSQEQHKDTASKVWTGGYPMKCKKDQRLDTGRFEATTMLESPCWGIWHWLQRGTRIICACVGPNATRRAGG